MRGFLIGFVMAFAVACGSDDGDTKSSSGGGSGGGAGSGATGATGGSDAGGGSGGTSASGGSGGVSGTGGASGSAGQAGSGGSGGGSGDADGDGIDDAKELEIAKSYFPYYSLAPNDNCPLHGVLFRLTPHPADPTKIHIWYDVLFQNDCGANGHVGDDEVFGAFVDPSVPAPGGLMAVRAISHQGTPCERTTTCGTLPNCSPCKTGDKGGQAFPLVFPSVNKHGNYADEGTCDGNFICDFGGCTVNPTPDAPEFANAGEPSKPLTNNLTTNGFITGANGWQASELMNYDPWGNTDFGGAGNVTGDLQDAAFVIPPSGC